MPDDRSANEPILELGTPDSGGKTANFLLILTIILTLLTVGFLIFWRFRLAAVAQDKAATFSDLQQQLGSDANKAIENKANSVNSALSVLSTAEQSKYLFRAFIDELSTKITNDTKLNSLSIDNSGKVSMDGESGSYRSVADLAVALQTSSKLKDVSITGLSQSTSGTNGSGKTVITFSISATIKDWKSEQAATGSGVPAANDLVPTVGL